MMDGRKIAVFNKERRKEVEKKHSWGEEEKNKLAGSSVRYERNALMVGKSRKSKSARGQNVRLCSITLWQNGLH